MESNRHDEFYIGWEDKAPAGVASRVRLAVLGVIAFTVLVAAALAFAQRTIGIASFEWGTIKEFHGVLVARPYPLLIVDRPGTVASAEAKSIYYLVAPLKFGVGANDVVARDGQRVELRGTLIYRENQTMIEVVPGSIKAMASSGAVAKSNSSPQTLSLGQQTLTGEIVDSKCFLGVMNPGQLAPHRACAVRCISGGIPPVLLVRQKSGPPIYLLLVSDQGEPVNQQVLDLVAEPVSITGEVLREGEVLVLRANPATYRRVTQ